MTGEGESDGGSEQARPTDTNKRVTFAESQPVETGAVGRAVRRSQPDPPEGPKPTKGKRKSKPRNSVFHQQKLLAYKPVLTPQKVIPFLLLLGLVFIPLGILFIITSNSIVEYVFDYTECLERAGTTGFTDSKMQFEWKRGGGESTCLIRFKTTSRKPMGSPVFLYYQLSNFYQNNRLYAKSYSYEQLMGEPLQHDELRDCEPLVGPAQNAIYYPCGLVANSRFSDDIQVEKYEFVSTGIAYEYDKKMYRASSYDPSRVKVYPPPSWDPQVFNLDVNPDGSYRTLPSIHTDERFMNWMRISGLPTFRKLYGRYDGVIPEQSEIVIRIESRFDTKSYGGRKAIVLSTASWMGGKNRFLGYAYMAFGSLLITVGLVCLARHLLAPRVLGDTRYLSWYQQ